MKLEGNQQLLTPREVAALDTDWLLTDPERKMVSVRRMLRYARLCWALEYLEKEGTDPGAMEDVVAVFHIERAMLIAADTQDADTETIRTSFTIQQLAALKELAKRGIRVAQSSASTLNETYDQAMAFAVESGLEESDDIETDRELFLEDRMVESLVTVHVLNSVVDELEAYLAEY